MIILLLILVPFWYYNNNNFVLFDTKVATPYNTVEFINNNIEKSNAIMAQPGYTVKLIYWTGNRVLGLPSLSENLLPLINYYDVDYIVFGTFYTIDNYQYAINSIKFVQEHPEKFKLVTALNEDYGKNIKDKVFIYKVIK